MIVVASPQCSPERKSRVAVPTPNNYVLQATTIYDLPQQPGDIADLQKRSRPVDKHKASMPFFGQKQPDWARRSGSNHDLIHRVGECVDILAGCSVDARIITCVGDLGHLSGKISSIIFYLKNNRLWFFGGSLQNFFCRTLSAPDCGYFVCIFWEKCLLFP